MVPAGEAGGSAGGTDDGAGDDRADTEDLRQRGVARPDRCGQLLPRLPQLGIEAAQGIEELPGELATACAIAPDGVTAPRTRAAWPAVISLPKPPGTSSHSTAWSRQGTWLRAGPDPVPLGLSPSAPGPLVLLLGRSALPGPCEVPGVMKSFSGRCFLRPTAVADAVLGPYPSGAVEDHLQPVAARGD